MGKGESMEKEYMVFNGKSQFVPDKFESRMKKSGLDKKAANIIIGENNKVMALLQDKLYAHKKEALLVIIQAMDAGGKDSMVKNVMSGLNPQATEVFSFKKPSEEELEHDYMWRCMKHLPAKGQIGIFNRSYYEDVLISQVHGLPYRQNLPKRCLGENLWKNRYRQIRDFERYFDENGIVVLKFFLHITKDTQKRRFLERINNPSKNWKFASSDIEERKYWDKYMEVHKEVLNETATSYAPWHIIPADSKWYARLAVSEFIIEALERIDPEYPMLSKEETDKLQHYKEILMQEDTEPEEEQS